MLDQYGKKIPTQLGNLSVENPGNLEEEELQDLVSARWYEVVGGGLFVALCDLKVKLGYDFELWALGEVRNTYGRDKKIFRVAEALKRYSAEDGFYHA